MNFTGKGWIPVFLLFGLIHCMVAQETILYTLPNPARNQRFIASLQQRFPHHGFTDLSQRWQILSGQSTPEGRLLHLPIALESRQSITLRRYVQITTRGDSLYRLRIQTLGGRYRVLLNDSLIRPDLLPYAENTLPLPTDLLHNGQNQLEIELIPYSHKTAHLPDWLPINLPRLNSGIIGMVLERFQNNQILDASFHPYLHDSTTLTVQTTIRFSPLNETIPQMNLTLRFWQGNRLHTQRQLVLSTPVPRQLVLPVDTLQAVVPWQPDAPQFYQVEVVLDTAGVILDRVRLPLAVRQVAATPDGFQLNFQPVTLEGINYIYQSKEGSQLFDAQQIRVDLTWIKQQGFNVIRLPVHPLPEHFFQISDELGLLCFIDLPVIPPRTAFPTPAVVDSSWLRYSRYIWELASRYNSIAAIGLSFFMDPASKASQSSVRQFLEKLPPAPVPLYLNTSVPMDSLPTGIDFLIVELLERNQIPPQLARLESLQRRGLILPSGYSKSFSYRVDSTTVIHDLLQMTHLFQMVRESIREGKLRGHFVPVYSDFYLQFPSLQNGFQKDFYLNRIGLVTLSRTPRQLLLGNLTITMPESPDVNLVISEAKGAHSYIYILVGLINLFLFLIVYRRFINFRHNINYAFRKPHGFFVNLQERILIPRGQTLFVMLVLSLNGAIILSSIMFFFRNNLLVDYLLSVIFFQPELKSLISRLIWNQGLFLIVGTAGIALLFGLLAVPIKLLGLRQRNRVKWRQAWSASVWAAVPFVFLVPLGAFMYNLLITMKSYWILIGILVYFHVWYYFRWINGIRVLTDRLYGRVFVAFSVLAVLGVALIIWFYHYHVRLFDHLAFIYHLYTYYH
ncbi:MAG: hypothetical protein GXO78_10575 [Calditrichaeota bacterium]|nr:hypothetical protein [Calditrichota bacterium]